MKKNRKNIIQLVLFVTFFSAAVFIAGCTESTSPETAKGDIKITMVDAPASYDAVNIVVTRVEVHKSGGDDNSGWIVINNNTATYDLLTLRNGVSAVIGNSQLDVGKYTQIRLIVGEGSTVVVNGVTHLLEIPSGENSGLKLNHSFEIYPGILYELLLDFDAGRSIVLSGNGQYKLKPVIRLIPMQISGSISGIINPVIAAEYVYAINGTDTAGTIVNPFTGSFKLMALLQQNYRIEIYSTSILYKDSTINNVGVVAQQNTNIGTINLSPR